MAKKHIIEEINEQVLKAITPGMSVEERQALRAKITDKVLEERAKLAKMCPNEVKKMWAESHKLGKLFSDIERKLGL